MDEPTEAMAAKQVRDTKIKIVFFKGSPSSS